MNDGIWAGSVGQQYSIQTCDKCGTETHTFGPLIDFCPHCKMPYKETIFKVNTVDSEHCVITFERLEQVLENVVNKK